MIDEEKNLIIACLNKIKEDYVCNDEFGQYLLPEYYALEAAIKSLAYEYSEEYVSKNAVKLIDTDAIPEGATAGDVIMAVFPNGDLHSKETEGDYWEISHPKRVCYEVNYHDLWFDEDFWNSPYEIEKVETKERDDR